MIVVVLHKSKGTECNNTYNTDFVVSKHPLNDCVKCTIM